jgi:hypothetical protein
MLSRIRKILCCCAVLALLLPCFACEAGAAFPRDPSGLDSSSPLTGSVLDRQTAPADSVLNVRDERPLRDNSGSARITVRDGGPRVRPAAGSIISSRTSWSRACLRYRPLLPNPPPHS